MKKFILNESQDIDNPGDVTFYQSLDEVLGQIEPIDVINNEYFLFDTDGCFYQLYAKNEISDIQIKYLFDNLDKVNKIINKIKHRYGEKVFEEMFEFQDRNKISRKNTFFMNAIEFFRKNVR